MDIMMPVMNGYDAAVGIRKADRPDADQIIIVAMTANAFTEDIQKAHECGMNAHISKPVEPDVIRETLLQLMGRQQEIR
jgi:CheY-like chemotaxis protein